MCGSPIIGLLSGDLYVGPNGKRKIGLRDLVSYWSTLDTESMSFSLLTRNLEVYSSRCLFATE
jgi:hypothetical protein